MGEYSVMSWVQLVAVIGSLATIVGVFVTIIRNNKSIDKDLGVIKEGKKDLSHDHIRILDLQRSIGHEQTEKFYDIKNIVGSIKERVDEERQRLNQLNSTEQNARQSVDTIRQFITTVQNERLSQEQEVRLWKDKYVVVVEQNHQLSEQLSNLQDENNRLKSKVRELTPHPEERRGRGLSR